MLKKLTSYLIRTLKHSDDVRACISRDFYVKDLTTLQKGKRSRIFDTKEIKAIVLKARDQQTILNTLRNQLRPRKTCGLYDDGPPLINENEDGEEQKEEEDDPLRNLGQTPMNTEEI